MKKVLFFIISVFIINVCLAQKEANHWFFGANAGLDFTSGSPVADTSGVLSTIEGCASISDFTGNLLFYTDGVSVWNRNHALMPTGIGLFGDSSSSQSAIIVPKPGDPKIYFIFTVDWSGGDNGLNYYAVDITLDNGLGDVVGLDSTPFANRLLPSPLSEKITVVEVKDEDAFWLLTIKQDRFNVFKIDSNGVNNEPVTGSLRFLRLADARGYLKVSPDGTKIASANMSDGLFLYDFDTVTGFVNNEKKLDVLGEFPYGVEFSPLGEKLYVSTGNFGSGPALEKLFQFDLDIVNPTTDNLNATRVELHSYTNQRAALQLANDGKIYRAIDGSNFLGVINAPEGNGLASNYVHGGVSLGDKISRQGLPPFIQSFFSALINADNVCFGDETSFTINSSKPILSIVWNFGDGSPVSTDLNPVHTFAASGDYTITVEVTTEDGVEIISEIISIFDVPTIDNEVTLIQCDIDTDGIAFFNLTEANELININNQDLTISYFLNQSDADTNVNSIIEPENFSNENVSVLYARAQNLFGCFEISRVNLLVSVSQIPEGFKLTFNECDTDLIDGVTDGITTFDFSAATSSILDLFASNQNLVISYYESIDQALTETNTIDPANHINSNSPFEQQIFVRIDNLIDNACVGIGSHITLKVSTPVFEVPEILFFCLNSISQSAFIRILSSNDSYTYEWRNSSGNLLDNPFSTGIRIFEAGTYSVTAISEDNCRATKTVNVITSNVASITDILVTDNLENNTITISITGPGDYEFALDDFRGPYRDENSFNNVPAGVHEVFVRDKNGCGITSREVSVIGFPNFFTPNGDNYNDTWQVFGVVLQPMSEILIFDRFGKIITRVDPIGQGWDGNYRGNPMPQSDYWYLVTLEDGRTLRGHFSLIRE